MPSQKIETHHSDTIHDVSIDYYGKRIATSSSDYTIKIISIPNQQTLATLSGHQGPVWQTIWAHPKFGSLLASCSYDGKVIIWKEHDPNQWSQTHVFSSDNKSSVNSICFGPHDLGMVLVSGSSDGMIAIHTCRSDGGGWDVMKIDQAHLIGVTSVSFAPVALGLGSDGHDSIQKIVSGGCDNLVKIWKLDSGSWKSDGHALEMHKGMVRDVAWAPNLGILKSTIASCSQDGTVVIWTLEKEGGKWEGKILKDFGNPVWRVSWSLTGNILAVADANNDVTLWKEAVDGEWQQVSTVEP